MTDDPSAWDWRPELAAFMDYWRRGELPPPEPVEQRRERQQLYLLAEQIGACAYAMRLAKAVERA